MTQRYDTYKDSGVQWLGEIPGHWECVPLKRLINKIESGVSAIGSTSQAASENEFGVLKTGCVSFRVFNPLQNKLVVGEECKRLACPVRGDTIIVSRMNTPELVGSCAFVDKDYPNLFLPDRLWQVYFCDKTSAKFLHWILNSQPVRNRYAQICVGSSSTMQNISQSQFSETIIPLPTLSEQHSIISFLDDKCGKIDEWVTKKQKEVEHLQELKQRVIADAVTQGLNPHVKMKQTVIPWLPEVPEHWDVLRLKSLFYQRSESYNPDETLQVLSLLKDVGVIPYDEKGSIGNKSKEDYRQYKVTRKGDIVMNSMNVIIGSVDITSYDGYISPAYYALCAKDGVCTEYYNYIFHLKSVQKTMRSLANGILEIRLRISTTNLFGMYYPVPPLSEQKQIVSYLEDKTSKIDKLIANITKEIERIKEYKQRLISDVVTGQIKVNQ
ncbi:MAG: restriction endonuclease subunit S [Prevotella sp.]|nr:restriction endonuclease subunit S [Prevotella sp.]